MMHIQLLAAVLCSCFILQDAVTPVVSATVEPVDYPDLTRVSDRFWGIWEDLNRAGQLGKLCTRSARNTVDNVFNSPAFWSSLKRVVNKWVGMTNDKNYADKRIRFYDTTADMLTNPAAVEGYLAVLTAMYDSTVKYNSVTFQKSLQAIFNAVNNGTVIRQLAPVSNYVSNKFNPSPAALHKGFKIVKTFLDMGKTMTMSYPITPATSRGPLPH